MQPSTPLGPDKGNVLLLLLLLNRERNRWNVFYEKTRRNAGLETWPMRQADRLLSDQGRDRSAHAYGIPRSSSELSDTRDIILGI
jgi:hypothetical protein